MLRELDDRPALPFYVWSGREYSTDVVIVVINVIDIDIDKQPTSSIQALTVLLKVIRMSTSGPDDDRAPSLMPVTHAWTSNSE